MNVLITMIIKISDVNPFFKYSRLRLIEPRIIDTIGLLKQNALGRIGSILIHVKMIAL